MKTLIFLAIAWSILAIVVVIIATSTGESLTAAIWGCLIIANVYAVGIILKSK